MITRSFREEKAYITHQSHTDVQYMYIARARIWLPIGKKEGYKITVRTGINCVSSVTGINCL